MLNGSKREISSDNLHSDKERPISNSSSNKKNKTESDHVEVMIGRPQFVFGGENSSKLLNGSSHFSIHPSKHLIAFCNTSSHRIIVYTLDGDHFTSFSHPDIANPVEVALANDLLYVCCEYLYSSCIVQFSEYNVKKVKLNLSLNQMWTPRSLECDGEGNLYFIDEFGHRVVMWNADMLNFREIDLKGVCEEPVDLFIRSNQLIILSHSLPHILYISLTDNRFYASDLTEYLLNPSSFCPIGEKGIIIADSNTNILKMFSVEKRLTLIRLEITIPSFARLTRIAMANESSLIIISEDNFYYVHILSN